MIYYVYTVLPCDSWEEFLSVEEYLERAQCKEEASKWLSKMRRIAAQAFYWEGNPHTECVSAMPCSVDNYPVRMYCAKQSNNGTTFVVSPVPIWHMHKPTGKYESTASLRIVEWLNGVVGTFQKKSAS